MAAGTAVVLPLPHRPEFLMFATHELLEAAQSAREEAEGFTFPSHDVHLANAQVMRTEYVVERARLEISGALRWVCGRDGQSCPTAAQAFLAAGDDRDLHAPIPGGSGSIEGQSRPRLRGGVFGR